jgi:general secretion pathway protein C
LTGERVTASLAIVGQHIAGWMQTLPLKATHNVLCGLLALWIILALLPLIGLFLPASPLENTAAERSSTPASSDLGNKPAVAINELQALNLFGAAGLEPVAVAAAPVVDEVAINAAKTQLNLSLEGVVYAAIDAESVAVIVYQGKQDQYHIGDVLPVGGQVKLRKVLVDHVIIDNSGRYESLWLYDEDKVARSASRQASVTDNPTNNSAPELAKDYRQQLFDNPASLAEVLRISPAQKDGAMVGYRVSPGKDQEQFSQLGFQPDDIVTSINEIELNNPSSALEVYKLLRTAKEANFTVDRNGQSVQVMVSLGDSE